MILYLYMILWTQMAFLPLLMHLVLVRNLLLNTYKYLAVQPYLNITKFRLMTNKFKTNIPNKECVVFLTSYILPDLPYQRVVKLRGTGRHVLNQDATYKHTGAPTGQLGTFPHEDYDMSCPSRKHTISDISDLISHPKRGNHKHSEDVNYTMEHTNVIQDSTPYSRLDNNTNKTKPEVNTHKITAYLSAVKNHPDGINNAEDLYMAHEQQQNNRNIEKNQDVQINLSDFIPKPRSLSQVLKLSPIIRDKWGHSIQNELLGLFDNDTFDTNEKALPANEVFPVKCAFKAKLNSYGGLDKLKARVCVRGNMQIIDTMNNWSPTASVHLLKCFLADAIYHKSPIYQLDFIQAFIQSPTKQRNFIIYCA